MSTWKIDPDHTVAAFEARHFMITIVRGQFNKISGEIRFDPLNASLCSVEATIETSGLYSGISKRDEHLRSADFLDVEKFPTITFKSTGVEATGTTVRKVFGDLTIRGITRPVTLDVAHFGPVTSPFGGETTMGFSATTEINRFEFDVNWNYDMENGGRVAGKWVKIHLEAEADLEKE
jgi:polyisoprenoid-binding protein YceI